MVKPDLDWIERAKENGLFVGDFVPFRYFNKISHHEDGSIDGYWSSWFVNEHNELQRFSETQPEKINDTIISWFFGNDDNQLIEHCNEIKANRYRDRLDIVSLSSLRRQRELWEKLQKEQAHLKYPPIEILNRIIQDRIANSIEEIVANHNNRGIKHKNSSNSKFKKWHKKIERKKENFPALCTKSKVSRLPS